MLRVALALAGLYLLVLVLAFAFQRRLLYPSAGSSPWPETRALAARGLAPWPGDPSRALVASGDSARGTVVVFHGNGGNAAQRAYYADALVRRGLRVVLAEYPGYGDREGAPSEAVLVADAAETLRRVHARYGCPLIVWGESVGSGVAAGAVRDAAVPIAGVALLTPWDRLAPVAQEALPFLPASLLLRDRYESARNLAGYRGPVAVLVAERDEVIPPARGRALFDALEAPKRLWTFPGAGHNSWPLAPEAAWWDEVVAFLLPEVSPEAAGPVATGPG